MDTTWSRYSLRSNSTARMPFRSEKVGGLWAEYLERFQAIKMARLIHPSSPCLDLCTLLFRFDKSQSNQFYWNINVHVSLDQVRRHSGP